MGGVQQLLVIGGILLLGYLALSFYRSNSVQSSIELSNEAVITGTGIGQSTLDEIQTKAFDQQTVSKTITSVDSLTAPSNLGPDSGETNSTLFNDIDDYNGFVRQDSLGRLGTFLTSVSVYYVNPTNPSNRSTLRTFAKRVDIFVTNMFLPDTIKLNLVIAY